MLLKSLARFLLAPFWVCEASLLSVAKISSSLAFLFSSPRPSCL